MDWPGAVSGYMRVKITHKQRKVKKFHFLKCWMFLFEGPDPDSLEMLDPDPQLCYGQYIFLHFFVV
jgi:hypothetical protein